MNRSRFKWPRRILVTLLLLILVAFGTLGWLGSERLVSPPRRALQDYHIQILESPADYGLSIVSWTGPQNTPCLMVNPAPHRGYAVKSRELRASLKNAPPWGEVRGTIVMLHGHGGRKEDHLPKCERFCAAGFRCILIDLPGHGDNPDTKATFGYREAELIEQIHSDAAVKFGFENDPAFLYGISQGGAIALRTAARNPDRWFGLISVASFSALDGLLTTTCREYHPAMEYIAPLASGSVSIATWFRAGYFPSWIRPADDAEKLDLPIMIIHGDQDGFIDIANGQEIHDRSPSPEKHFLPIEGGTHGFVIAKEAAKTYPAMCEFFLSAVPPRAVIVSRE